MSGRASGMGGARETIVGIDLGTTHSLVAIMDERGPRVIPDAQGRALLPSVVRYGEGDRPVVGWEAKDLAELHPRTTISSVKRLMGRGPADVASDLGYLSYRVVEGEHRTARVAVPIGGGGERVISPPEVSAEVLRVLRERASSALGAEVRKAVITVPAYFDDAQRQATRDAGRLAGLEVVRIINEPTAAAMAYGFGVRTGSPRAATIAVYDFGGGTFDISILRVTPGQDPASPALFQVISTAGETRLGGDDIDHALMDVLVREIAGRAGLGPGWSPDPGVRRQLKTFAERVKVRLSDEVSAAVRIDLGASGVYERTFTRDELEALCRPMVDATLRCCRRAVGDARVGGVVLAGDDGRPREGSIDAVVLVGGSTRIPLVRREVGAYFGVEPYVAIDPDQAVALGAAVQAGVLSGVDRSSLLLDVIPLSLGVGTVGGGVAKIITRNATVPCRAREMFSTSVDNQTSIELTIYQGEREMAADCRKLGEFRLRGLPPMPAGIPQVEVEFVIDQSGVLSVLAHERRSGRRASLQVIPNHGLSREEVDRIEFESYAFAREDMTRHRVADLIVSAKLDLKWIGERLDRHAALLEPAYRQELAGRIASLRGLIARAEADWRLVDAESFAREKTELERASMRLQEISITESLRENPGPKAG